MSSNAKLKDFFFNWEKSLDWARHRSAHFHKTHEQPLITQTFKHLPKPPSTPISPTRLLKRALVINKVAPTVSTRGMLEHIHEGALESVLLHPPQPLPGPKHTQSLTLTFLTSTSAFEFASRRLENPERRHVVAGPFSTWKWLPPLALPGDIAYAVGTQLARRAICLTWPPISEPSSRFRTMEQELKRRFGALQWIWAFDDSRLIVNFQDIRIAIEARKELENELHDVEVRFFPDWCEVTPTYRARLLQSRIVSEDHALASEVEEIETLNPDESSSNNSRLDARHGSEH
ncbi:hypothetical protein C8F01DRAFT_1105699 [Mycena amicta]|nr:hypothetical protein C8F01DRAFT_1105699 [Mycena amicta]